MKKLLMIFVLTLALIITGCSALTETSQEEAFKTFVSEDERIQLTAPSSYTTIDEIKEMNVLSILGIGNKWQEKYVSVIAESKIDMTEDMDLEAYYEILKSMLELQISNSEFEEVENKEINGYDAKTFTIRGEINNLKFAYLYSIIETPDYFYQVITWTFNSRFEKHRDEFDDIIKSFTEL